jgi:signal peptidase I
VVSVIILLPRVTKSDNKENSRACHHCLNCIKIAEMKQFLLSLWEVLEILVVALISIFIIYSFIAQPFQVQGASMEPNFHTKQYLIVDEISYRLREPERGEVVVFHNPRNESEFYIKRIIGLPGEEISIKNNKVFIVNGTHPNGFVLNEPYLPPSTEMPNSTNPLQLGKDEYFVMGDNRLQSFDSRSWGPVKRSEMVGVVRMRLWPPTVFAYAQN